jgi:hypothetical protein
MDDRCTPESRQAALARDAETNRITPDPILPAYGAPGVGDQLFNLRALPADMMLGFRPDHMIVRSTLRSPYGGDPLHDSDAS